MVCSLYGKPFNGYMGIALAVPLEIYDISKVDISRCSDTKKIPREPEKGGGFLRKYFVNFPVDWSRSCLGRDRRRATGNSREGDSTRSCTPR